MTLIRCVRIVTGPKHSFALINRFSDQRQNLLVMSAVSSANSLAIALPDLRSRLQLAVTFKASAIA